MREDEVIQNLEKGVSLDGLNDIRIKVVKTKVPLGPDAAIRADVMVEMDFDGSMIRLLGEIKTQLTPKILKQIGPWLSRASAGTPGTPWVLISPYLSEDSQDYCRKNKINFMDLSGNLSIRIPGKTMILRLGRPNKFKEKRLLQNPFSKAASRVVRVLLQYPGRIWTITGIGAEIEKESKRQKTDLRLSLAAVSRTVKSLEENILVRREGPRVRVPDPGNLLSRWADKYRERWKWERRGAYTSSNPFGADIKTVYGKLREDYRDINILFTGTVAASVMAPYADVEKMDIFIMRDGGDAIAPRFEGTDIRGPDIFFIYPYDNGVAMYAKKTMDMAVVSDIQVFLDCYARGGRDVKQADYILTEVIEKRWQKET